MQVEPLLKKLKYTLQEIIATAKFKSKEEDFLYSPYWDLFEKQIEKWLLALAKTREWEFETASEILEEIEF